MQIAAEATRRLVRFNYISTTKETKQLSTFTAASAAPCRCPGLSLLCAAAGAERCSSSSSSAVCCCCCCCVASPQQLSCSSLRFSRAFEDSRMRSTGGPYLAHAAAKPRGCTSAPSELPAPQRCPLGSGVSISVPDRAIVLHAAAACWCGAAH